MIAPTWLRFDSADWDAFAGATAFQGEDGEPLVCYDFTVDGYEAYAILDAEGIELIAIGDGPEAPTFQGQLTGPRAARWAVLAAGKSEWNRHDLEVAGFEEL